MILGTSWNFLKSFGHTKWVSENGVRHEIYRDKKTRTLSIEKVVKNVSVYSAKKEVCVKTLTNVSEAELFARIMYSGERYWECAYLIENPNAYMYIRYLGPIMRHR